MLSLYPSFKLIRICRVNIYLKHLTLVFFYSIPSENVNSYTFRKCQKTKAVIEKKHWRDMGKSFRKHGKILQTFTNSSDICIKIQFGWYLASQLHGIKVIKNTISKNSVYVNRAELLCKQYNLVYRKYYFRSRCSIYLYVLAVLEPM